MLELLNMTLQILRDVSTRSRLSTELPMWVFHLELLGWGGSGHGKRRAERESIKPRLHDRPTTCCQTGCQV